jgi:hypothetical protein
MDQMTDEGAYAYGYNSYEHMRADIRNRVNIMHNRARIGLDPSSVLRDLDERRFGDELAEMILDIYYSEIEQPDRGASLTARTIAGVAGLAFGFGMARRFR